MVAAFIILLNDSVMPALRLMGTFTEPLAGIVETTSGGDLSGGGSGPLRPHAVMNNATASITADDIIGFIICIMLLAHPGVQS
jgi:hypothetical protein